MNLKFTEPMRAASLLDEHTEHTNENILAAMEKLIYPVLASRKKDGVRGLKFSALASKTLRKIPNKRVQEMAIVLPSRWDVEIGNDDLTYNKIQSIVMSKEHVGSELIKFYLIDKIGDEGYSDRYLDAYLQAEAIGSSLIVAEQLVSCKNATELMDCFLKAEDSHQEGICFRLPNGRYKCGRSTLKEQLLVKLARFSRTELTITGFIEQQENGNPTNYNAVGFMDRSSCKSEMIGKDTLGAFICKDSEGRRVDVGTGVGLTDRLRKEIWDNRDCYHNKQITVKFKQHGMKDVIRHPIFCGFRPKGI